MDEYSDADIAQRKKGIFDGMSPRSQKRILKMGYDRWDPFQEPKDPIDIRKDRTKRTTQELISGFLQECPQEGYGNNYAHGALKLCLGIINDEEESRGMFDFSVWYYALLKREGHME